MKENKKNDSSKDIKDSKVKNNLKIDANLQKIKTPTLLTEKEMTMKERDVILKTKYSATLKSSAENFLVDLFEKISTINNYENVNLEVPISAAMAIITNTSWHQPTEAQIEYDFTRECIDKGIYDFNREDEYEDDEDADIEELELEELIIEGIIEIEGEQQGEEQSPIDSDSNEDSDESSEKTSDK